MHDRIADQHQFQNVVRVDHRLGRRLDQQIAQRLAHRIGHLGVAARIHHHIADPAHQILAEADLRVHRPDGVHDFAGLQVGQVDRHGGRPDIDGAAEGLLVETGPDMDQLVPVADRRGDLPFAFAQGLLQPLQHRQVGTVDSQIPLLLQGLLQPLQIAGRVVHVGFFDLDIMQADDGIDFDIAHFRALADDLFVNLAVRRDVDDQIAVDEAGTTETPVVLHPALLLVPVFDLAEFGNVFRLALDLELGEIADARHDLAAAADAAPAADGIEVDAQLTCGLENRRSNREIAAFPGGGEDDMGRLHVFLG